MTRRIEQRFVYMRQKQTGNLKAAVVVFNPNKVTIWKAAKCLAAGFKTEDFVFDVSEFADIYEGDFKSCQPTADS